MNDQFSTDPTQFRKEMNMHQLLSPSDDAPEAPSWLTAEQQRWVYGGIVTVLVLAALYGFGILRA